MKVLIDGDIVCYRCGFAAESYMYRVLCEERYADSDMVFTSQSAANTYLGSLPAYITAHIDKEVVPQPLKNALGTVKRVINRTLKDCQTTDYQVFLTNTDLSHNFRYKIDNTYKANRKGSSKPFHYDGIRNYLLRHHPTLLVDGQEADDEMGIVQVREKDTCIASIDKDMLMIPGLHYNFDSELITAASDPGTLTLSKTGKAKANKLTGVGFKWFAAQILLGDVCDNIKGLKGYGPVKVLNLLDNEIDIKSIWRTIVETYHDETELHKNARLLWIRREPEQMYTDFLKDVGVL